MAIVRVTPVFHNSTATERKFIVTHPQRWSMSWSPRERAFVSVLILKLTLTF